MTDCEKDNYIAPLTGMFRKIAKEDFLKATECHKTGCRNLETRCTDCGRLVNSTEIPIKEGNSGWLKFSETPPKIGMFIAAMRIPFLKCYWIGLYKGVPNEHEDLFHYWLELPEFPEY